MKFSKNSVLFFIFFIIFQYTFSQSNKNHEFRGVWIATKENIDWPSAKNLSTESQKKEIIKLLNRFKSLNFNAVILQIRPASDAFYNSKYEPWSSYLTGTNDQAPSPYYDPLAFIINETHKRGMEFHAWLNPYRALVNYKEFQSNPFRLTYEKPEWFINYGENKYFNPGIPEVREYTNKVVTDIVQNYDVDAIHFDDYFYPYKISNENFPDQNTFEKYGEDFYPDEIDNWRRENVNLIIQQLHTTIKAIKPWVQFGISPFGVWRNKNIDKKGSDTEAGQTNYDDLYADILLWIKNGWIDYILPQVYWHIGHKKADYSTLANWWANNTQNTNLYIGHSMYRLHGKKENRAWKKENPTEIEKQLDLNRNLPEIQGSAFFSAKSFHNNYFGINDILKNKYYQNPVLPPTITTKEKFIPEPVYNVKFDKLKNKKYQLSWQIVHENKKKEAVKFLLYRFQKNEKTDLNKKSNVFALTGEKHLNFTKKEIKNGDVFIIQAVSRNNITSKPISISK